MIGSHRETFENETAHSELNSDNDLSRDRLLFVQVLVPFHSKTVLLTKRSYKFKIWSNYIIQINSIFVQLLYPVPYLNTASLDVKAHIINRKFNSINASLFKSYQLNLCGYIVFEGELKTRDHYKAILTEANFLSLIGNFILRVACTFGIAAGMVPEGHIPSMSF